MSREDEAMVWAHNKPERRFTKTKQKKKVKRSICSFCVSKETSE